MNEICRTNRASGLHRATAYSEGKIIMYKTGTSSQSTQPPHDYIHVATCIDMPMLSNVSGVSYPLCYL